MESLIWGLILLFDFLFDLEVFLKGMVFNWIDRLLEMELVFLLSK